MFSATGAVTGNMVPTRVTQQAPNNTRSALQRLLSVKGSWRNNQEFTQSKPGRTCPLVDLLAADNYGGWREGSHSETTGYPMRAHLAVSAIDGCDFFRGEGGWKNHFEHFDVVAVAKFAVANVGRLVDA